MTNTDLAQAIRAAATAKGYNVAALDDASLMRWARELPPDTQRELSAASASPKPKERPTK